MRLEELPPQQFKPVVTTCPACKHPALYLFNPDRYFHLDGTPNRPCWFAILGGVHDGRTEKGVLLRGRT